MTDLTIWKYEIPVIDHDYRLAMPRGAEIIHTAAKGYDLLNVWAIVNPKAPAEARNFAVRGTGHPLRGLTAPEYVATVMVGPLVWHLFEVGKGLASPVLVGDPVTRSEVAEMIAHPEEYDIHPGAES